jgi:hypothetical protein
VLYIGKEKPTMPNSIQLTGISYKFNLVWIKNIRYQAFLKTEKPALMLLGALADYGDKAAKEVMKEVVSAIQTKIKGTMEVQHYLQQLHILSNIHDLQQIFSEIMFDIAQLIDEEKDPFFQRGEQKGLEKGLVEGLEKGLVEGLEKGLVEGLEKGLVEGLEKGRQEEATAKQREFTIRLWDLQEFSLEKIALLVGVALQQVKNTILTHLQAQGKTEVECEKIVEEYSKRFAHPADSFGEKK